MEKHFSTDRGECSTGVSADGGRSLDHHAKPILALPHGQAEISVPSEHSAHAVGEAILDAPLRKIFECFGKDSSRTSDYTKENTPRSANRDGSNGKLISAQTPPVLEAIYSIYIEHSEFRILKHTVNLFPSVVRERNELRQAWKSRETGEEPSPTCFNSRISPNPIMNILIWNRRGAMKPTFRKTVMDLVEWHQPVITETRIDGPKADEIIKRLPFDRAYSTKTIGYAGRIWLLWRSDFVSMDVLMVTKQEIHTIT